MKMTKIAFSLMILFALLAFAGIAQAKTDVLYIVRTMNDVNPMYLSMVNEAGLNYTTLTDNNLTGVNFSDYNMILVDDNDFSNARNIPINEYPALIMNRNGLAVWGWSYIVSQAILPSPYAIVSQSPSHTIMQGVNLTNIPVYTTNNRRIIYLDDDYVYRGLTMVASTTWDQKDAVIAVAPAGTVLTSQQGKPPTYINANSVFFGLYDSGYWTQDAKLLFRNSLRWILDKDGDGYIGNQDCDDNDPLIPGLVEIIYNGKDDDCNAETPDYPAPLFLEVKTEPRTPTKGVNIAVNAKLGGRAIRDVTITYKINGGEWATKDMNFQTEIDLDSSIWVTSLGSFNLNDQVVYTIYANNLYGPEATSNEYIFTVMNELVNLNLQMYEGYNLMSLPLFTGVSNKDDIFANVGNAKTLLNGQLVDTTSILMHKGYFVYSDTYHTETIQGAAPIGMQSLSLNQGMNLVGIASITPKSLDLLPPEVVEVSKRSADGSYTISTRYPGRGWHNPFPLEAGKGYWMKATAATIWEYTA